MHKDKFGFFMKSHRSCFFDKTIFVRGGAKRGYAVWYSCDEFNGRWNMQNVDGYLLKFNENYGRILVWSSIQILRRGSNE